ncbi:hypothetical protein OPV22_000903 [Ensete ventricosum]|uniref:BHLH domain-containing protein n=1 Tax=Ensete ventricosum TaxID=4639 RepID=A0AAV8RK53_ENSVE|nr:hypothetical protein OPV22_000903 [Ensete ventricosum]
MPKALQVHLLNEEEVALKENKSLAMAAATALQALLLALNLVATTRRPAEARRPRARQSHAPRRRQQAAMTKRVGGSIGAWNRKRPTTTASYVAKKMRTLRLLVPNGEAMELDGLLRGAADHILHLQLQVKVMQMMVTALSPTEADERSLAW